MVAALVRVMALRQEQERTLRGPGIFFRRVAFVEASADAFFLPVVCAHAKPVGKAVDLGTCGKCWQ